MSDSILYDDNREYFFQNSHQKLKVSAWALFSFLLIELLFSNFYHFHLRERLLNHFLLHSTIGDQNTLKMLWIGSSPSACLITDFFSIFRRNIQHKSIDISRLKSLTVLFVLFLSFSALFIHTGSPSKLKYILIVQNLC